MTIVKPRGRMRLGLATLFDVGDAVILTSTDDSPDGPRLGETGVVKRIYIAEPADGDCTFLVHDVRWSRYGQRWPVADCEIALARGADEYEWLRGQLNRFDVVL